jgi:hypothetical protein
MILQPTRILQLVDGPDKWGFVTSWADYRPATFITDIRQSVVPGGKQVPVTITVFLHKPDFESGIDCLLFEATFATDSMITPVQAMTPFGTGVRQTRLQGWYSTTNKYGNLQYL